MIFYYAFKTTLKQISTRACRVEVLSWGWSYWPFYNYPTWTLASVQHCYNVTKTRIVLWRMRTNTYLGSAIHHQITGNQTSSPLHEYVPLLINLPPVPELLTTSRILLGGLHRSRCQISMWRVTSGCNLLIAAVKLSMGSQEFYQRIGLLSSDHEFGNLAGVQEIRLKYCGEITVTCKKPSVTNHHSGSFRM